MSQYQRPSNLNRIFDTTIRKEKAPIFKFKKYPFQSWVLPDNRKLILSSYKDLSEGVKIQINQLLEVFKTDTSLYPQTNCLLVLNNQELIGVVCYMDHEYLDIIYRNKGNHNLMNQGITCNFIYVYNLVVSPRWRRLGYAEYLLETLYFFVEKRGKKGLNAQIKKRNLISSHLFKKLGFIKNNGNDGLDNYLKWIDK